MLMLRGTTYYYRRSIPLNLRPLMNGKREVWKSLHTSDKESAKTLALAVGLEVERHFQSLRKQAERAQTDPHAFARQYVSRTLAEDAQLQRARDLADDGTFESSLQRAELLDIELDSMRRAIEDHRASLRIEDTKIISTLLDEVLQEQGLYVPVQRRQEFALALLKARVQALELMLKRSQIMKWCPKVSLWVVSSTRT
jgi:hypothetical protein